MAKKEKSLFWASYADLMTSLFFVMLVLFIGAIVVLDQERREFKGKYETSKKEKEILEQINDATKNIDSTYFEYKEEFKKHKLKISVNYGNDVDQIKTLPELTQKQLLAAGVKLRDFVQETTSQNPNIQYLLIIEGQASINESNITGESIPVFKTINESVYCSTIVENGYLKMLPCISKEWKEYENAQTKYIHKLNEQFKKQYVDGFIKDVNMRRLSEQGRIYLEERIEQIWPTK